jgi:tRNA threonylcarbamoyladenosine biosynthesis protein TsaB
MKILAIESSAKAASVAVCDDEKLITQYYQNSGLTHSRTLMSMLCDMLKNADMELSQIDTVAVAIGPGSFTGIRIGVATAKGIAWGAGKGVCGVSTLEAMAWPIEDEGVIICPVMDARRGQVYNAKFMWRGGKPERICDDRAIAVDELLREAQIGKYEFYFVGDGAMMCYNHFRENGVGARLAPEPLRMQSAWGVARASLGADIMSPGDLVLNYIRPSQAERERFGK